MQNLPHHREFLSSWGARWNRVLSRNVSRGRGCGTESTRTQTRDLAPGLSSAVGGAMSRTSVAASPNVAISQAITGQTTTSAIWWDALLSRDHSAATVWRSALIAKEIRSNSAEGA